MTRNRLLSGVVAAIYIVVALCFGGAEAGLKIGLFLILPLACIWFSEPMGGYTGPVWRGVIHLAPAMAPNEIPEYWVGIGPRRLYFLPCSSPIWFT
jgi:hypothetical protein